MVKKIKKKKRENKKVNSVRGKKSIKAIAKIKDKTEEGSSKENIKSIDKEIKEKSVSIKPQEKKRTLFKSNAKKNKKQKISIRERRRNIKKYLLKAGSEIEHKTLSKRIFNASVIIVLIISFFFIYKFSTEYYSFDRIFTIITSLWTFVFISLLFIIWGIYYLSIDLRIFKRNKEIEDVLPDFLQLTASNIKAGMTTDRALWYAIRPRFGVLAREIEEVAKQTISGKDLREALEDFVDKYDSVILKRSISLLIEGMDAGGEVGELLIRIASNIQETKIMKEEMAANVTTYVIFISFATVGAAPFLFALSGILITVVGSIGSSMGSGAATSGFAISFSGTGISYSDFFIFALVTLTISSIFSASIISTITKGNVKSGFKYIPIFIVISIVIYLVSQFGLNMLFGGFF